MGFWYSLSNVIFTHKYRVNLQGNIFEKIILQDEAINYEIYV